MNRLKSSGDSRAPCRSLLYSGRVVDSIFLYIVFAFLSDMKFVSYFLLFVCRVVFRIFHWSICVGMVSEALFMFIMASLVLLGEGFWLNPSRTC